MSRGYVKKVPYDDIAGAPVYLGHPEHVVHQGREFTLDNVVNMIQAQVYIVGIFTPNHASERVHMEFIVSMTGEYTFEFYEGVTFTGTPNAPFNGYNRNRLSSRVSGVTMRDGYTGIATFDELLETHHNGATTGQNTTGGSRETAEWILKPNEVYAIKVTATGAGVLSIQSDWQELIHEELM